MPSDQERTDIPELTELVRLHALTTQSERWTVEPVEGKCYDRQSNRVTGWRVPEASPLGDMECAAMTMGNADFTATAHNEILKIYEQVKGLIAENNRFREAIRTHRAQKADDRCIEDDDRLYEALEDGVKCDRRVGDKAAMLANCERFITKRCEAGGWPTYVQLEDTIAILKATIHELEELVSNTEIRCNERGRERDELKAELEKLRGQGK